MTTNISNNYIYILSTNIYNWQSKNYYNYSYYNHKNDSNNYNDIVIFWGDDYINTVYIY